MSSLSSFLLVILAASPATIQAWGRPLFFEPMRSSKGGGFGRATTFIQASQRHSHTHEQHQDDEELEHVTVADSSNRAVVKQKKSTTLFNDFLDSPGGGGLIGELFYPEPLLWQPITNEDDEEDEDYSLENDEDFYVDDMVDCYISEEFKVDEKVAAEAFEYLGIKRVEPIPLPSYETVGEFE